MFAYNLKFFTFNMKSEINSYENKTSRHTSVPYELDKKFILNFTVMYSFRLTSISDKWLGVYYGKTLKKFVGL